MAEQKLRLEWLDPKSLKPNTNNWRKHPERQKKILSAMLKETGWAGALLLNEVTGHLIDGHARQEEAIKRNDPAVPVLVGSWSESDEKKILATLDPIGSMAEQADSIYKSLLEDLDTDNPDIMSWYDEKMQQFDTSEIDFEQEWQGMPEFTNEDKTGFQDVIIHFKDKQSVDDFAQLVGQRITPKTKFLWYPEIEIDVTSDKAYVHES